MTNRSDNGGEADGGPPVYLEGDFKINVRLRLREAPGVVIIDLDFGGGKPPYMPASSYVVSLPTFGDLQQANEWAARTSDLFFDGLKDVLVDAMRLHLMDTGALALGEADLLPFDKKGILQSHLSVAEHLERQRLKMEAGRHSRWTAEELAQAIRSVMESLPKALRTYPQVAKKIQEMYPGRGPKSGESLRKTVETFGIDWMRIKREVQKRS